MSNEETVPAEDQTLEELRAKAEKAEGKLMRVQRFIFGALLLVMDPDEIMARLIQRGEKKKK